MAATTQELLTNARCLECGIPSGMQMAVLISLFAEIADVAADPQTLMDRAACWACVPTGAQLAVLISLAQDIVDNGGGGGGTGGVTCGAVDPVAAPANACTLYYNTENQSLFMWDGVTWLPLLVEGAGVTCGVVDPVAAPATGCGVYYRTDNGAFFLWDGAAWQLKV